jgi:hypothetical protein
MAVTDNAVTNNVQHLGSKSNDVVKSCSLNNIYFDTKSGKESFYYLINVSL